MMKLEEVKKLKTGDRVNVTLKRVHDPDEDTKVHFDGVLEVYIQQGGRGTFILAFRSPMDIDWAEYLLPNDWSEEDSALMCENYLAIFHSRA